MDGAHLSLHARHRHPRRPRRPPKFRPRPLGKKSRRARQRPRLHQQTFKMKHRSVLRFGAWSFSGTWMLVLGALILSPSQITAASPRFEVSLKPNLVAAPGRLFVVLARKDKPE